MWECKKSGNVGNVGKWECLKVGMWKSWRSSVGSRQTYSKKLESAKVGKASQLCLDSLRAPFRYLQRRVVGISFAA